MQEENISRAVIVVQMGMTPSAKQVTIFYLPFFLSCDVIILLKLINKPSVSDKYCALDQALYLTNLFDQLGISIDLSLTFLAGSGGHRPLQLI